MLRPSSYLRGALVGRVALALACLASASAAVQRTRPGSDPYVPFPVALFGAYPNDGDAPLTVRFTDRSLGVVTSWTWDFGDGTSSSLRNPTHLYTEPGVYAVSLTAVGPGGRSQRVRPEGVTARGCTMGSARTNRVAPLERGEDFVPVTGDDALGFYCVYSGKAVGGGSPGLANNVGIFVLPLVDGEVLLFGSGYGDQNSFVEPTKDASYDVRRVDAILRFCLGREPERTPIRFVAPHGHIDHINSDFIRELRERGYPIVDIAFHNADGNTVRNLPGWTSEDRAAFRTLRTTTGICQEELTSFDSPLGRIWFFLREGHTPGSIDLVIDVRGDPDNRFVVRGSGEVYGTCPIPGVREAVDPHGNLVFHAPAPKVFGLSPANASVLGNTTVVLSGTGFAANLAGRPSVLFDGVPGTDLAVLADDTLTCVVPPGLPGSTIDLQVETRNGRAKLVGQLSYRALPNLSAVSPLSGPSTGGTLLTLRGSGFLANAAGPNTVLVGGAPASGVRVLDDTTLQCNAPPGALGPVNVRLANLNGVIELHAPFRYVPPIDVVSAFPALGSARGGTAIQIDGTGFAVGASVPQVFFGANPASSVVRLSDTRLTCVTPTGPGGTLVDVRVSGENGSDALTAGFRYYKQPEVRALSPASGPELGGAIVTLTGSQFTRNDAGPNVVTFGERVTPDVLTVSDTVIQCRVPAGVAGTRVDVSVSNANGTGSLAGGYRYFGRPVLTGIEPAHGGGAGGTLVTLQGANFLEAPSGTTTVSFGATPASAVTVLDDGTLTCRTPPGGASAQVTVTLTNPNGSAVLPDAFRYVSPPLLFGLQPEAGASAGGTLVTLAGQGFLAPGAGATAVTFAGAPASSVQVLDDTRLVCRSPFGRPDKSVDVVLTNANGSARLERAFHYLRPPTVVSVRPARGPATGGTRVRVTGSGLTGTRSVRFGGALASDVQVLSDETLECTTPSGPPGAVDVSLLSLAGPALLSEGFVFGPGEVTLAGLAPDHGPSQGGNRLVLTGSGFRAGAGGATTVTVGGAAATSVVVQDDLRLTCVAPLGAPGSSVDVRVSNSNGSVVRPSGYRYSLRPALARLAPDNGSPLGGVLVTLHGQGFVDDEAREHVVRFGGRSAEQVVVLDDATLTCLAPAGVPDTSVDVEYENSNGAAQLAAGFHYRSGPTLTSLSPGIGSARGGTPVTLVGTRFTSASSGTLRVLFGPNEATQVVVSNDTVLTCLAPPGTPGEGVDVTLASVDGADTLPAAFRYFPGPLVTAIAPPSGRASGGTLVILTGRGFKTDVSGPNAVTFGGTPARNVVTVDDTRVRAIVPSGAAGQSVDLVLSNSNGVATVSQGFRYNPRPSLLALDPPAASGLGGTAVTIHGSGFLSDGAGTNSVLFGDRPAVAVVTLDDQTLRCFEPGGPSGEAVAVSVTNQNGSTAEPLSFPYFPAPRIDELVPPFGFSGGGTLVELRGAAFLANAAGTNTVYFGADEASEVSVLDDGTLLCRAPSGSLGPVDLRVVNANGAAAVPDAFFYDWAPTVTGFTPALGTSLGGTEVRVTGGGFETPGAGPLGVRFGAAPATNLRVLDGATLLCDAPPGAPGTGVSVLVTNSHGSAGLAGFQYRPEPTLTAVEPASGPPEGGTLVTLRGTGFLAGDAGPARLRFAGVDASEITVVDDSTLVCRAPAGPARTSATIVLDNANGSASFVDGFRWRPRTPGDLDGDGLGDLLCSGSDGAYLFFGVPTGLGDEGASSADLVLRHSGASTDFGGQTCTGDLNGDGLDDLVVAAPLDDSGGTDCGAVYVYFGPLAPSPSARLASSANAIFRGASPGDRFGTSVAVGDVGGDGLNDLVVGAPLNDSAGTDAGAVYVYRGKSPFAGQSTAQAAVRLLGPSSQDNFGAVLALGDVTGDTLADVVVGAPFVGFSSEGAAYVFRGGPTLVSTSAGSAQVQLSGDDDSDHLGSALVVGDFDGDGVADLFLGAPDAQTGGTSGGMVYFLRGGASLSSRRVDQNSVELWAEGSGDRLGQALAIGDANGDARADVLVGAPLHNVPATDAGRAYLLLGGTLVSGSIGSRASTVLVAENSAGDQFGTGLALLDLDDDGRDDLIVGAPSSNANGTDSGRAHVFLGSALQATRSAGADDATFTGSSAGQRLGREIDSPR